MIISVSYPFFTEGADYFDAACNWVKDNRDTWENWFWECENDCFGQGVCNNGTCACLTGFEGEFCESKISNKFFYCTNGTTFIDETGLVEAPDLRHNPDFIPYDLGSLFFLLLLSPLPPLSPLPLFFIFYFYFIIFILLLTFSSVCDEIMDCNNWADEKESCSPSIYSGTIAFAVIVSLSIFIVLVSLVFIWVKRDRGRIRAAGVEFLTQLHLGVAWGMSRLDSFFFASLLYIYHHFFFFRSPPLLFPTAASFSWEKIATLSVE